MARRSPAFLRPAAFRDASVRNLAKNARLRTVAFGSEPGWPSELILELPLNDLARVLAVVLACFRLAGVID